MVQGDCVTLTPFNRTEMDFSLQSERAEQLPVFHSSVSPTVSVWSGVCRAVEPERRAGGEREKKREREVFFLGMGFLDYGAWRPHSLMEKLAGTDLGQSQLCTCTQSCQEAEFSIAQGKSCFQMTTRSIHTM